MEKRKLSRKERKLRGIEKQKAYFVKISDYAESQIAVLSKDGILSLGSLSEAIDKYITRLIKEKPQEAELIRKAALVLRDAMRIALDGYVAAKKKKGESNGLR